MKTSENVSGTLQRSGPGRRRCGKSTQRILRASFELLAEKGWDGFTIEGVAARAEVSKATVYRWWPDRGSLAVESFLVMCESSDELPDTGCLAEDLKEQVSRVVGFMTPCRTRVLRAVFVAVQESPGLREDLELNWSPFCRKGFDMIVGRAVVRGQVPSVVCARSLFEAVFGPVFFELDDGARVDST